MVKRVDVLWPGDEPQRRCASSTDAVRRRAALELHDVTRAVHVHDDLATSTTTIARAARPNRTRFSFEERYHLTKAPWKWFEGPIYGFINKKNEDEHARASKWLTDHPEYRADLADSTP